MKAPFNFVPLSDKVFFPDWADQISHDIPFEDGESGTIELKITAKSPIFVRNGHTKDEAEKKEAGFKHFSNIDGNYFIPATSIKGSIRNVLEITSFGKMDKIANQRYSLRDLHRKQDYLNFFQNSDIHCGWMTKEEETITISDHGIPKRISHVDLDILWGTSFSSTFQNATLLKDDSKRTAYYKIDLSRGQIKTIRYNEFLMNSVNPVDKRIIAKVDPFGAFEGTIVLTGQPSARKDRELNPDKTVKKKGEGKCFEFVFPNTPLDSSHSFNIEDELFKDFCFIYHDSEDWKYWKKELDNGNQVPVFFSLSKNELLHFGLSYLYKLPYKKRIKDYLPIHHQSNQFDLSECIFGNIIKNAALKGRVQFSHAFLESGSVDEELLAYMGSPKSSYYPIYLQQQGENGYMTKLFITMMSDKAKLKGWKRYPIREERMKFSIPEGQDDQSNPLIPIKEGAVFNCKIRFHNLKKVEIGALLYVILLNNNGLHTIGFAKPHGFGAVKVNVSVLNGKFSLDEYKTAFIEMMKSFNADYTKSTELKELYLMSTPQKVLTPLEYMDLDDFVSCKKQNFDKDITGEYLDYYSSIVKVEKPTVEIKELSATVLAFISSGRYAVKLKDHKDISTKTIKNVGIKLKKDDIVKVKRSNINDELVFIKKYD